MHDQLRQLKRHNAYVCICVERPWAQRESELFGQPCQMIVDGWLGYTAPRFLLIGIRRDDRAKKCGISILAPLWDVHSMWSPTYPAGHAFLQGFCRVLAGTHVVEVAARGPACEHGGKLCSTRCSCRILLRSDFEFVQLHCNDPMACCEWRVRMVLRRMASWVGTAATNLKRSGVSFSAGKNLTQLRRGTDVLHWDWACEVEAKRAAAHRAWITALGLRTLGVGQPTSSRAAPWTVTFNVEPYLDLIAQPLQHPEDSFLHWYKSLHS